MIHPDTTSASASHLSSTEEVILQLMLECERVDIELPQPVAVAVILSVSVDEVYAALDSLERRGDIETTHYRAVQA